MLVTSVLVLLLFRVIYRIRSGRCQSKEQLDGRTVIVTGASAVEIIGKTGNQDVFVEYLDLANLDSVRLFCQKMLQNERHIHVLVNNAGIVGPQIKQVTQDGLELTMATNHYGHFLLTNLLLNRLRNSAPSRIINVSSAAHMYTRKIDLRDLNYDRSKYSPTAAYAQSKLCNILFTNELAKKLQGTEVTANSLHPGAVATEFFSKGEFEQPWYLRVMTVALSFIVKVAGKTSELGAQTTIYLAVSSDVEKVSGKYFEDCKISSSSSVTQSRELARSLWEVSEADVQLRPREVHY